MPIRFVVLAMTYVYPAEIEIDDDTEGAAEEKGMRTSTLSEKGRAMKKKKKTEIEY